MPTQKKLYSSKTEYPLFTGKLLPSHKNSYSPKITLFTDENHEKTWFLELINKKTMKKRGFCELRFFKIAPTGG
jgi:hypothetical protein